MPELLLLKNPRTYVPCPYENMLVDVPFREFWVNHFVHHSDIILRHALETYGAAATSRALAFKADLSQAMQALATTPHLLGELDLLVLNEVRQKLLFKHGIPDAFLAMKTRENTLMLKLYPRVVAELESHPAEREQLLLLIEGIFAGNIFDMGAGATAQLFATESPDFFKVRGILNKQRPWLIDDFEILAERILHGPKHRKCLLFLDNAGSDTVLGVIPLARWLAQRGTLVRLAANHLPTLNDMTYLELVPLLEDLAHLDPVLAKLLETQAIQAIDSGGTLPLIDLRKVSERCNREAADADLLVLEGMGRALESNFDAFFNVDALKICMIKEKIIADRHGGKVFDCVLRFDSAA